MDFLTNKDALVISSFNSNEKNTFDYFNSAASQSNINVEVSVYDNSTNVIVNTYNFAFHEFNQSNFVTIHPSSNEQEGNLYVDTPTLLDSLGFIRGNYRVTYKFYLNILGSNDNRVFIRKISSTRKEIIVDYINKDLLENYKNFTNEYFNRFGQKFVFDKFLNLGGNNLLSIVNSKNQSDSTGDTLILKLYEQLPPQFSNKDTLWIIQLLTDEIEDTVSIDFEVKTDVSSSAYYLKPPKYDVNYDFIGNDYTGYKNYGDLVDSSSFGNKFFSSFNNKQSISGIELNTKYKNFEEFVHFGSATQMLENFKNKLLTIEQSDTNILTSSISFQNSSSLYYENKKFDLIGNFSEYEKFLYFKSGSYFSSSVYPDASGTSSVIDATYPKTGADISSAGSYAASYTLYAVSSSEAQNWFATMSAIAFEYDYNNMDALVKTLPEYIHSDIESNQQYINFVNMIGEFYDNVWLYISALQRKIKRENKFEDGVPGELIWNILRSYGLNLNNGQNLVDLTGYKYGYNVTASLSSSLERSEQIITQEIWNRILNNYPYILKSKGTEKSIRALFNCYGIPSSFIEIQEFGGPSVTSSLDNKVPHKYSFTYEDFTFVVNMNGQQSIYVPWQTSSYDGMKPDSIEFKMKTNPTLGTMDVFSLNGTNGEFKLILSKSHDEFGKFILMATDSASNSTYVTSSIKPFYNNEFYSILVKRSEESDDYGKNQNYYLKIQNHDDYINKIITDETDILSINSDSSSFNYAYIDADNFCLGGATSSIQRFSGSFDELRLWAEPIEDDTFTFHTKYSLATNGNTLTSSLSALAFRLSFNDAFNLNSTSSLSNDAFNTSSYGNVTASAINFPSVTNFPYNFSDFERSNTVEQPFIDSANENNKIRIERNDIFDYIDTGSIRIYPLKGNYRINGHSPQGEVGEFDSASIDIDTLLIGFSPVNFENRDIIAFYGNNDFLSVYGDFQDIYKSSYPNNNFIIDTYWNNTKNGVRFNDYIKYINTYNRSLFDTISDFVPAKASLVLGTVYEQNILRRNRIKLLSPEKANNYQQHLLHINQKNYSLLKGITSNDLSEMGVINVTKNISVPKITYDDLSVKIDKLFEFSLQSFNEILESSITYKLNEFALFAYNDVSANRQRFNTDRFRTFVNNTKNSSLTTADRGPAVVLTASNPKKLVVNYADNPKLIVK